MTINIELIEQAFENNLDNVDIMAVKENVSESQSISFIFSTPTNYNLNSNYSQLIHLMKYSFQLFRYQF